MKQIVITDKGIGMAEMPKWPNADVTPEWLKNHEYAKTQAISEALYFEDQERVRHLMMLAYSSEVFDEPRKPKHGTYPIPPDFPKVVEVRKFVPHEGTVRPIIVLRFVDKQEQRNNLVELMKEDEKNGMYMSVIPQTREEKMAMYMAMDKENVCEMLVNCNQIIDSITPKVVIEESQEELLKELEKFIYFYGDEEEGTLKATISQGALTQFTIKRK